MFAKDMTVGYLLDFYGEMLTERSRSIMEQYYGDDLSLGEIAENFAISRQGVRSVVKHAEQQLLHFEQTLGLAAQFREIGRAAERIRLLAESLGDVEIAHAIDREVAHILSRLS